MKFFNCINDDIDINRYTMWVSTSGSEQFDRGCQSGVLSFMKYSERPKDNFLASIVKISSKSLNKKGSITLNSINFCVLENLRRVRHEFVRNPHEPTVKQSVPGPYYGSLDVTAYFEYFESRIMNISERAISMP